MTFRTPFIIQRLLPGSYQNGFWVEGELTELQIDASVQPVKGEELQVLSEARRASQIVKIYTSIPLNINGESNPDRLLAFNSIFEIMNVEPWQSGVISHYKAIGYKLEGEEII